VSVRLSDRSGVEAGSRFNLNRAQVVDDNFTACLIELGAEAASAAARSSTPCDPRQILRRNAAEPLTTGTSLTCGDALAIFESMVIARHQDLEARAMRARGEGFYTIGSAGHELNAVVGRLTRHTDMAFLHYRSGGFMAERARQVSGIDFIRDTMLSFAASAEDPIAGGRHRVWGSRRLNVPPQTSTIASHLPKAVGCALALGRARRLGVPLDLPSDSIVVCSFGDASVNHASAQTAFNAASWSVFQRIPVPVLFVCEDNGIGISVETPTGWIAAAMSQRPGIAYFAADGLNLIQTHEVTREAVRVCRTRRTPVFLHLRVVRLLGHAGSDAETEYHTWEQIEAAEARDPLPATARLLVEAQAATPTDLLSLYESVRRRVREASAVAAAAPRLTTAEQIVAPLAPLHLDRVHAEARREPDRQERLRLFGGEADLPENGPPRHMAALINLGLHDLLLKYPESFICGEDVARKGGVYHVTTGLWSRFGAGRVFNTLLDETMLLGLAVGAAHLGLLPIPEIQYLAYYHNAEDQIRGEACSLQFFSNDQFRNPMVIRINGWGYQKGFGGHFHNDNSIAALRDVPGLIICTPSRGDDAVKLLRTCLALARIDGRVVAFIEPIALYMTKDLHETKDRQWSFHYPPPGEILEFGQPGIYHAEAGDLVILTFANGVPMSLRAAKALRERHDLAVRVVDLRWLNPLNETAILEQARSVPRVLVVDEGRRTGGVAESILSMIHEQCGHHVTAARLNAHDTYVPLGPAAELIMPQEHDIVAAALNLLKRN